MNDCVTPELSATLGIVGKRRAGRPIAFLLDISMITPLGDIFCLVDGIVTFFKSTPLVSSLAAQLLAQLRHQVSAQVM
jgi:hypothetical protein